ncbi:unnamed protein product [Lactuca saligna]|uniref:Uncharacterized protein n=1 Tax=Lactuca saligna TaxID=75948 RepID=A0AA36EBH1_LACSI|nr:unnamed protein product [Lactuca saligna]
MTHFTSPPYLRRDQRIYMFDSYRFSEDEIKVLIDGDNSYTQLTGRIIHQLLDERVQSSEPGDFLAVHYNGHDTRLPAETGDDDDIGYEECIVPNDFNLINGMILSSIMFL